MMSALDVRASQNTLGNFLDPFSAPPRPKWRVSSCSIVVCEKEQTATISKRG